ncbi:hypothetical protein BDSB_27050 [Burkholderia dolosa PC543]|nr:hypothetical protein BDSB_27050 [Burkholderia dolosa PC543]
MSPANDRCIVSMHARARQRANGTPALRDARRRGRTAAAIHD